MKHLLYELFTHCEPLISSQSSLLKVSKGAKIRNRYNQVPHLTQDTNGKVTNFKLTADTTNESQLIQLRGAFGKFLAWYFISVAVLQTISCLVSF